jgi:hypothetical protein
MYHLEAGWKALYKDEAGRLRSAINIMHGVTYRVNRWTRPIAGNGPLTVFRQLSDAQRFIVSSLLPEPIIKRCIYVKSDETSIWTKLTDGNSWLGKIDLKYLPVGTVLADAVMLVE